MKNLITYLEVEQAYLSLIKDLSSKELSVYKQAYPETALFKEAFKKLFSNDKQANHAASHAAYHSNLQKYHQAHSLLADIDGDSNAAEHHKNLSALHEQATKHYTKAAKGFQSGLGFARTRMKKGAAINNEINQHHNTYNIPKSNFNNMSKPKNTKKYTPFNNPTYNNPNFGTKPAAKPNKISNKPYISSPPPPTIPHVNTNNSPPKPLKPKPTPRVFNWQKPNKRKGKGHLSFKAKKQTFHKFKHVS